MPHILKYKIKKFIKILIQRSHIRSKHYYYYEQLYDKFQNEETYLNLIKKIKSKPTLITPNSILFGTNLKFNYSYNDIKEIFGKAYYKIENIEIKDLRILFYRLNIGGQKAKAEIHLFENKIFLMKYTFSYLTEKEKKLFLN